MRTAVLPIVGALAVVACAAAKPATPPADAVPHVGDEWFAWRAETLGISVEEARARDAALPDGTDGRVPADGTLDESTRVEAAVLWSQECARCHGARGVPPPAADGQVRPRAWDGIGPNMGFLFGGDRMRAGIYKTISQGKGSMAGWGDALSREQIWALVAHIESF